jgi:hypothetical protein
MIFEWGMVTKKSNKDDDVMMTNVWVQSVKILTVQIPTSYCQPTLGVTSSQWKECFKFSTCETFSSCYGIPIKSLLAEEALCALQYFALMSNKSLEFCIKNFPFFRCVSEGGVILLSARFAPQGHMTRSPSPRLFMPHYVLPQFPFSGPLQPPLSVHMILLQLPASQTWELSLMILLLFLCSVPAVLCFEESTLFHLPLTVSHTVLDLHAIFRHIQKLWILPTRSVFTTFRMVLTVNSDCFPKQLKSGWAL